MSDGVISSEEHWKIIEKRVLKRGGDQERKGPRRGGGGAKLFRFSLNEDMGATTANKGDADILKMDGTDTTIDADVEDPEAIFGTLADTDTGLCLKQGGSYYIIQAACP